MAQHACDWNRRICAYPIESVARKWGRNNGTHSHREISCSRPLRMDLDISDRKFYTWRSRTVRLFRLRIAAENTSVRGKDNSVNGLVFQTEVRGAGLNHLSHIVQSLQKYLFVEIESLFAAVSGIGCWILHMQPAPLLPGTEVRVALRDFKSRFFEQKRRGQIVQECIASEIELMQFVPGRRERVTVERPARCGPFLHHVSLRFLNPHAIRREVSRRSPRPKRSDRPHPVAGSTLQAHLHQTLRHPLQLPKAPADREL